MRYRVLYHVNNSAGQKRFSYYNSSVCPNLRWNNSNCRIFTKNRFKLSYLNKNSIWVIVPSSKIDTWYELSLSSPKWGWATTYLVYMVLYMVLYHTFIKPMWIRDRTFIKICTWYTVLSSKYIPGISHRYQNRRELSYLHQNQCELLIVSYLRQTRCRLPWLAPRPPPQPRDYRQLGKTSMWPNSTVDKMSLVCTWHMPHRSTATINPALLLKIGICRQ